MKSMSRRLIGVVLVAVGTFGLVALLEPVSTASNGYPRIIACPHIPCDPLDQCAYCGPHQFEVGGDTCFLVGCDGTHCTYSCSRT
jgi:hypothetical protein